MTFNIATAKPERAPISSYKPTAEEEKLVRDALAYLVFRSPFFSHITYSEMNIVYTLDVPRAATDSYNIFINPREMLRAGYKLQNCAFVVAHEVFHYIYMDLIMSVGWRSSELVQHGRQTLPYNHMLMNMALDYRINAALIEAKVGVMPPNEGLYDKTISEKGMEPATEIYFKLYRTAGGKGGQGNGKQGQQPGSGHGGFDIHLEPSKKAKDKADSGQTQQAIVAAAEVHKAAGKGDLPAGIARMISEILEPKVSWQDHLRSTILRSTGDPMNDWSLYDRRLLARPDPMYLARQTGSGAGVVVVGVDTSGSITDAVLNQFFGELGGIIADVRPADLRVVWCDAHVHRVDQIEEAEDIQELKMAIDADGGPGGGGGTSFIPVFEWVHEQGLQPDLMVYLTDLMGSFPKQQPDYPVVWGTIYDSKAPFGTTIYIND